MTWVITLAVTSSRPVGSHLGFEDSCQLVLIISAYIRNGAAPVRRCTSCERTRVSDRNRSTCRMLQHSSYLSEQFTQPKRWMTCRLLADDGSLPWSWGTALWLVRALSTVNRSIFVSCKIFFTIMNLDLWSSCGRRARVYFGLWCWKLSS